MRFKEWLRQEIVDDDPWDTEALSPEASQTERTDDLETSADEPTEPAPEKILEAKSAVKQNRSHY